MWRTSAELFFSSVSCEVCENFYLRNIHSKLSDIIIDIIDQFKFDHTNNKMRHLFSEVNGWIMTLILVFNDGSNNEP